MGHMSSLAKVVRGTIAMLRFPGVVRGTTTPLHHVGLSEWPCHFPLIRARHMAAHVVLRGLLLRIGPYLIRARLTTNREGHNLPQHTKPCSNQSIEPHHGHLTSRRMEDQHSQYSTQAKLKIIKMERLVWWLQTTGLSNTTNHKNPILKYEGLGN
jgi:hypothetical protein